MNNPYNLDHTQRGITPTQDFGRGINCGMSSARRVRNSSKSRENVAYRAALHRQKSAAGSIAGRMGVQTNIDAISQR